jgi:hypothetical protein
MPSFLNGRRGNTAARESAPTFGLRHVAGISPALCTIKEKAFFRAASCLNGTSVDDLICVRLVLHVAGSLRTLCPLTSTTSGVFSFG